MPCSSARTALLAVSGFAVVRKLPATGAGGLRAIGKGCFPNTGSLFGYAPNDVRPLQVYFNSLLVDPDARQLFYFPLLRIPTGTP